jgi:hypothetical protein
MRRCSQKMKTCAKCEAETKAFEAKQKRDHELTEKREALEKEHRLKLQEIDQHIREQQELRKNQDKDRARRILLSQRSRDLVQECLLTQRRAAQEPVPAPSGDRLDDPHSHAAPNPCADDQESPSASAIDRVESSQSLSGSKTVGDSKSSSLAEID